jgi:Uma2 family endonuclease
MAATWCRDGASRCATCSPSFVPGGDDDGDPAAAAADDEEFFPGAPDLAVEVISPRDRAGEVAAKVRKYLTAGARMVVVIDPPKRTVVVHQSHAGVLILNEADTLDGGDVVPGWTLPVRDLFA